MAIFLPPVWHRRRKIRMEIKMRLQKHKFATRLFTAIAKFAGALQNLPNKITPPPFRLLQISSAFWQSRILYVAARLDIAGILGEQTLTATQIAEKTSAKTDAVNRLMRFLVAIGIFEQVAPEHFRNNKLSACLREDNPQNIRAMILMHHSPEMSRPWYEQLEAGVTRGQVPFQLTHQQELFAYMADHPQFTALFDQAMDRVEALSGDSFASDFAWQQFGRVFDIGGGVGSKAVAILKHHPQLRAHVVDQAQVIAHAQHYWQAKLEDSVLRRLTFSTGDVLTTLPEAENARDIYFLSAVFHGFDDATCLQALQNLTHASKGSGARIAIMELVTTVTRPDSVSTAFDMQMFMGTRGRERCLDDWQRLFSTAGLQLEEVVGLRGFGNILVVRP
jgi:hypothetical protein